MLEINQAAIKAVAEQHQLDVVVLFGSQATGRTHVKSDIDIAVLSRQPVDITKLMTAFSDVFKREDVEVVNLGTASPTLWQAVIRDGRLLYEKSPDDFARWRIYASKIWMETKWLRDRRDRKLINWSKQYELSYVKQ